MPAVPYGARIGLLVALCLGIAAYDRLRHGPASRRWKEYLFILLGAVVGALFGGLNDFFITSRLSPEYFRWGKGIAPGEGFEGRVLLLGLQAGCGPGALTACVFLFSNSRRREPLPWTRLTAFLAIPVLAAVAAALSLPPLASEWDPLGLRRSLGDEQGRRFLRVWWIHLSHYAGALLGLALGTLGILRSAPNLSRRFGYF